MISDKSEVEGSLASLWFIKTQHFHLHIFSDLRVYRTEGRDEPVHLSVPFIQHNYNKMAVIFTSYPEE